LPLRGGYLSGRPFDSEGLIAKLAPFMLVAVAAIVAVAVLDDAHNKTELALAAAITAIDFVIALTVPWARFPAFLQAIPPLAFFAVVGLLRDATGGGSSLINALVLLPVLWFALYGTSAQFVVSLIAGYLTLALPPLIGSSEVYPLKEELLRALLWVLVAGVVGYTVRRLVDEVRKLAASHRSVLETAHDAFISMDAEGLITDWNTRAENDFGWRREEVMGLPLEEVIIPRRLRASHRQGLRRFLRTGQGWMVGPRREVQALRRDGREFPVEISISALRGEEGDYVFNAFIHDISARSEGEKALRGAEERFRRAFDDAGVGMALVGRDGKWQRANQALADITGYPVSKLITMGFRDITQPDDLGADIAAFESLVSGERERFATETRYVHAEGHVVWIQLNVSAVRDEHGGLVSLISQMQDITERKAGEARLSHQAMHDPLTGLPNRSLFGDRMLLARARLRRGGMLALLFIDLDGFKEVNDRLGHEAGDRLLAEAAGRLSAVLRPADTVARFGGDEFVVLCENVDREGIEAVARRIDAALARPCQIHGRDVTLAASTGIVFTTDPELDADDLLAAADAAMYEAKRAGRSRHVFFDPARHVAPRVSSPREALR
jgi:diguanylate cyclase (GGDEF)-like protein/PAS domain S-box-containing protein